MITTLLKSKFDRIQQLRGRQEEKQKQLDTAKLQVRQLRRDYRLSEQAQIIIQQVAKTTQKNLEYQISNIVSLALATVFDDPYEFEMEFVVRRNKTECDLWFKRNDERIKPIEDAGLGAVNVACFALKIAAWKISQPRSRNIMIFDEPFIRLKGREANLRALKLAKTISSDLKLQIIMISDERVPIEDIKETADKIFITSIKNGVTSLKEI